MANISSDIRHSDLIQYIWEYNSFDFYNRFSKKVQLKILSLSFLHLCSMVDHDNECRLKYNLILSHMTYAQITTKTMMSTLVLFLGLFASICIHGSVLCMGGNSIALTNKQNFIIILSNQLEGKIWPIFHPFVFKFNSPEVAFKFFIQKQLR